MKTKLIRDVCLASALFAAGFSLCGAAEAAKPAPAKPTMSTEAQKFNDRREAILASQDALERKLKDATEAQKKEIYAQMEAQKRDLLEASRAMARQMREDARKRLNVAPATKP